MIVTKLQGGVGNQMFQYAAGRALSERIGAELVLDLSWYEGRKAVGDTSRPYGLDVFSILGREATAQEEQGVHYIEEPSPLKRRLKYLLHPEAPKLQALWEAGHQYNQAFEKASDNTWLVGFWQTEKYFTSIADVIRQEFTIKPRPSAENERLLEQIKATNAVSLHVRRGDYVKNAAANKFHGLVGIPYYNAGIKHIARTTKDLTVFVFSDEPEWCRDNLKFEFPTVFVGHNAGPKAYEDLRLMSSCRHHIIANSSFSWWGAWLNPGADKIVVGPRQWFLDDSKDTSDVLPKDWIAL